MITVTLRPDREKLGLNHHPWVYSGAIDRMDASAAPGELVRVVSSLGKFVAYGQFNPTSKIRLRLMEWNEKIVIDTSWYEQKLDEALHLRSPYLGQTTGIRLVFAESDGLPGLIVDRFGAYLVVQFLTSGADLLKAFWTELLIKHIPGLLGILEKSDGDGRRMEGLEDSQGLLWGKMPEGPVSIQENGVQMLVDLGAQKTGFYSDQRENRFLVSRYAKGRRILDAFCYSGGFSLQALKAGATSTVLLDSSSEALDLAQKNLSLNGFSSERVCEGDAFETLRQLKKEKQIFGLVVLDPPKLAGSRENLQKALRGYKDLNLQALALVETGGYLATFSCSGLVDEKTFFEVLAYAAKDAGRSVQVIHHFSQAPCHPVKTSMPEGAYLKGLFCRIL